MAFDQLEDFDAKSFFYLISRNRGSSGIRSYVRATANPQPGWLAEFLAWWLDPNTGYPIPEYATASSAGWSVSTTSSTGATRRRRCWPAGLTATRRTSTPRSATFIKSTADDNPIGLALNPAYKATINAHAARRQGAAGRATG